LIEQRGWTRVAEYTDNSVSAAGKVRRPAFVELLAAVGRGEVQAVVAWALDRLVRTARDRLALVEACRDQGVVIALVRGSDMDPTTPAGRLTLGVLGEVAQHEIDAKGDRQRRAAQQAAEQGKVPASVRAFGWTSGRTEIIPAEAEAVRAAYRTILAGGSLRSIARAWNDAGLTSGRVRTGRGVEGQPSRWSAETVRTLLINPRNAALRALNGRVLGEGQWPAIVPQETFEAARAALTDPARRQSTPARKRLLSGLATCGKPGCGASIVAGRNGANGPTYRCRSNGHVARAVGPVDRFISDLIIARLSRADAADLLIDDDRPDVEALRTELAALRVRLETIAAEFGADAAVSPAEYRVMRKPMVDRIEAIEGELNDAGRVSILAGLTTADDVRAVWESDDFDIDRKRAVVNELLTIVLHPPGQGAKKFDPTTVETQWKVSE